MADGRPTEVVALEQRVKDLTRRLEATERELEAFTYSVSHDLRAPLRGINFYTRMFVEGLGQRDEKSEAFHAGIMSLTKSMGDAIEHLLRLSRLGRAVLNVEQVNLSEIADGLTAQLKAAAPERRADIVIHRGLAARGDRELLRVVLDNLLSNAWKFTSKLPWTAIEMGSMTEADGTIVFFVRDNGVGFDMQYADKLFAPFQRLHRQEEFGGEGVGLATVQRIVHRHGGRVWADAHVGEGAAFFFTLPA
jgi:light-regulated signal transduction histidine kinase (bacteriophytochrome)